MKNPPFPAVPEGECRALTPDGILRTQNDRVVSNIYEGSKPAYGGPKNYCPEWSETDKD